MPRDGSNIYTVPPGTDGVPDATISSVKYNGFIHDVETDLNTARPIVAGGTGAGNSISARDNLDAEVAGALVTNFDSHVFENGSFHCAAGATAAPTADGPFVGVAIIHDATHVTLEARAVADSTTPGRKYVRQKVAGSWGVWVQEGIITTPGADGSSSISSNKADMSFGVKGTAPNSHFFVNSESDGSGSPDLLKINRTTAVTEIFNNLQLKNATAGSTTAFQIEGQLYSDLYFNAASKPSWLLRNTASSGDFTVYRYDQGTGALIDSPLSIDKASGHLTIKEPVVGTQAATMNTVTNSAATKVSKTGDTMTGSLTMTTSGPVMHLSDTGGTATFNDILFSKSGSPRWYIRCGEAGTGASLGLLRFDDAGAYAGKPMQWNRDGTVIWGAAGNFVFADNVSWRFQTDGAFLCAQGFKPGGGAWIDTSDSRIKTVAGPYEQGLAEIKQVNPVRYTFKGNATTFDPKNIPENLKGSANATHATVMSREFIGVVAQEVEQPMPELVTQITGWIDGQQVDDLRILDPSALTYALINAVKELSARVEALEAAGAPP